jgi:hypothetical protein
MLSAYGNNVDAEDIIDLLVLMVGRTMTDKIMLSKDRG